MISLLNQMTLAPNSDHLQPGLNDLNHRLNDPHPWFKSPKTRSNSSKP
jgi:hypothetical protein